MQFPGTVTMESDFNLLSPRVARLYAQLQDQMLNRQETWRPVSSLQDPEYQKLPFIIRRAQAFSTVLDQMPIEINQDELIVGRTARNTVILRTSLPDFALPQERDQAQAEGHGITTSLSHKTPDYPDLLQRGLRAIISDADRHIERLRDQQPSPEREEKINFFNALMIECEAVIRLSHRYAHLALLLAQKSDSHRAGELLRIAEICRKVPEFSPSTFQEAVQSVWMVHYSFFSTNTGLSLGRLDQYLGAYLENDLAENRLTLDEAQELVDCLWIKFNDRAQISRDNFAQKYQDRPWQAGYRWRTLIAEDASDAINHWGQNILLSGIRPDGGDGTNRLTYLCLNAMERFELTSPVVTVRMHKGSPAALIRRCAEVLKKGGGMPYINNDDTLIPAYEKLGVPFEDASDYANSNCWETMIAGKSDQELIRGFNFLLVLEWALNRGFSRVKNEQEGIDTGDPRSFARFDDLMDAWKQQMDAYVSKCIDYFGSQLEKGELYHSGHGRWSYNPLLSALVRDCVDREKDVIRGGARYSIWHMMAEAVANCIDSMAAIKKLVFEDQVVSLETVIDALSKNWEGYENLRQQMIARAPKFANEIPYADTLGKELLSWFCNRVRFHAQRYPSILFPCAVGTFSWYTSIGREVSASCDGRKHCEPITPNFSPNFGMDLAGPTAAVKSYCQMPVIDLAGGAPLDLRFAGNHLKGEEGTNRLAAFLKAFILLGGNMMTVTVTDVEILKRAMLEPMKYRGLRVRMGGWTAYFIALNPEQQRLHIRKVEHGF